jgi:hypothetical protein
MKISAAGPAPAGTSAYRIRKLGVPGFAKFLGMIGLVWGLLAGVILLATYIQGYMTKGDITLVQTGLFGFAMMIVYGIIGGVVGGAIIAFVYNKVLGPKHGIELVLETKW